MEASFKHQLTKTPAKVRLGALEAVYSGKSRSSGRIAVGGGYFDLFVF